MNLRLGSLIVLLTFFSLLIHNPTNARPASGSNEGPKPRRGQIQTPTAKETRAEEPKPLWQYGGFIDLAYSLGFNFPQNHVFRDRSTTPRVDELDLNMAAAYVKKDVSEQSRLGMELLVRGGQETKTFGFAENEPPVPNADWYRHFGRANVSYLAPVGNGLTVQAGTTRSMPRTILTIRDHGGRLYAISNVQDQCDLSVQRSVDRQCVHYQWICPSLKS